MKKLLSLVLAMMLMLGMVCVSAEDVFTFDEIGNEYFIYSSGAGAWFCELCIKPDGHFTGFYHDSDMGDADEAYPDGTVYECSFHGTMVVDGPGEYPHTWLVSITEIALDDGQNLHAETIRDGIRCITSDPADLEPGQMTLYTPGADLKLLSEDAAFWFHLNEYDLKDGDTLPCYGIYDAEHEIGFVHEPNPDR